MPAVLWNRPLSVLVDGRSQVLRHVHCCQKPTSCYGGESRHCTYTQTERPVQNCPLPAKAATNPLLVRRHGGHSGPEETSGARRNFVCAEFSTLDATMDTRMSGIHTFPHSRPDRDRLRNILRDYADDPERADRSVFGRVPCPDRRGFLQGAGLTTMCAALGATIPFYRRMPAGFVPEALAQASLFPPGKDDRLTLLNDRPLNAETPAHLLDDDVTPTALHFVRNNGIPPERTDPDGWTLTVDGEVGRPLVFSVGELRKRFEVVSRKLLIECGGNGRSAFDPPVSGNQWTLGAVGNAEWTGVRMSDVLKAAELRPSAVYTGHFGRDNHLSGNPEAQPFSRGIPIRKAMDPGTLIAFAMNGGAIHPSNGAPLRIVVPGWTGSCSQKWLTRIWVRDQVHDSAKMKGMSYRVPRYPVAPGEEVPKDAFRIIEEMPVKSLITNPRTGMVLPVGTSAVAVRGHAWAGDHEVRAVSVSVDFGSNWLAAELSPPPNRHSWQRWRASVPLPSPGYYEIWARATDSQGRTQPFAIAWNPKGYLNNAMHRVSLRVAV